jgi:GNAT superfamily N-acetyltransferase
MTTMEWTDKNGYRLTDDPAAVDLDRLTELLNETYWAFDRPRVVIEKSLQASLTLSVVAPDGAFAGFGRAVTDRATFAWIADVVIDPAHRNGGLGTWLVDTLVHHPDIAGLTQVLRTKDAHGLYARFGFTTGDYMCANARSLNQD